MKNNNRQPLADPGAVIDDHGGEASFWLAWVHDDLAAEVQQWFREQARTNPALAADVRSVEQADGRGFSTQAARELMSNVLEATGYLPPAEPEPDDTELTPMTDLAGVTPTSDQPDPMRELVRPASPAFLEELGIEVPSSQEATGYTQLLTHLVGREAVQRFRRLRQDTALLHRQASAASPPTLYRALRTLVPELCAGATPPRLSYRLFLRARLKQFCRQRGWQPRGRSLESACKDLTRARIGRIVEEALQSAEQDELHAGLQLACADCVA